MVKLDNLLSPRCDISLYPVGGIFAKAIYTYDRLQHSASTLRCMWIDQACYWSIGKNFKTMTAGINVEIECYMLIC